MNQDVFAALDNAGGCSEALTRANFWVEHGIATNTPGR